MLSRRDTTGAKAQITWEWKVGERYIWNGNHNGSGVAILISNKINFNIINIIRNKERHFTNLKRVKTLERCNYYESICT